MRLDWGPNALLSRSDSNCSLSIQELAVLDMSIFSFQIPNADNVPTVEMAYWHSKKTRTSPGMSFHLKELSFTGY